MNEVEVRERAARLFPSGERRVRSTRVAVEHELLAADVTSGAPVPVERVRAVTRRAPYAAYLGFEPGGQVELSLPTAGCPADLSRHLRADLTALRRDCSAAGIRLIAQPVDARSEAEVPLQLVSPRYVAMQRHFDTIGPAGRTMMRRTASTQVCLDWWPGRAGVEQWRLLQLASPFLAAAFARTFERTSRLATWLEVDPTRTAFDGRLLHGDDPTVAYANFAMGATVFTAPTDVDLHLTTLFPPVRPRGRYLEVRFPDVQQEDAVAPLVAALASLTYDDLVRSAALRRVAGERDRLDQHWYDAAHGTGDVAEFGRELVALTGVRVGSLDGAA
ncbi:MAG: glutamate-cysteine ligase family protein [Terracoccus sp.]